MKSEFPLLSKLIFSGVVPPLTPDVHLVSAQEATDRYWASETEGITEDTGLDMRRDLGCLAPPFTKMWIESDADLPAENSTLFRLRVGYRVECHTFEQARDEGFTIASDGIGWVYRIKAYDEATSEIPGMALIWTDPSGVYKDHGYSVDDFDQQSVLGYMSKAALFAISLMNCRNVAVSSTMTRERGGKKSRRKGTPAVEYRVIHLPQSNGSPTREGGPTGTVKLHTARGHFKTYTAEAPLMGKHTGTYYWGWQVRGKKENGEIVSNYQVGVPA